MIFNQEPEGSYIYENMDEIRGHYAKQNKPGKERQILSSITNM